MIKENLKKRIVCILMAIVSLAFITYIECHLIQVGQTYRNSACSASTDL